MAPVLKFQTMPPRSYEREDVVDYVFPERLVVDETTFAEISERIANPREPNAALRALFAK